MPATAHATGPPQAMNEPRIAPFRVLVADDHRAAADSLRALIEATLKCPVDAVYDGSQALAAALATRYDALVLDLDMPGMHGLEVARAVRRTAGDAPPLLMALTGHAGVAEQLEVLDRCFDHVLAKPADPQRLMPALAARRGVAPAAAGPAAFDAADVMTRAAQRMSALLGRRRLTLSFDYRGPAPLVLGRSVDLQCGLHRLASGVADVLASGFMLFVAEAEVHGGNRCRVRFTAAGTGVLQPTARIDDVVQRLEITEHAPTPDAAQRGLRAGRGICPNTGSLVEFACSATEGVMFRTELDYALAEPLDPRPLPDAAGARAWLIDADVGSAWRLRRLQRLGWATTAFATPAEAIERLRESAGHARRPQLVLCIEDDTMTLVAAAELHGLLGPGTRLVLAARAGSPTLALPDLPLPELDVRVHPLSPRDLMEITRAAASGESVADGDTQPAPMRLTDRPLVLVVDDNEINLIVASGLLEALGCEVRTARDGLDAIEACKREAPQAVLMDLQMPVLGGLEATRRLRALQKLGAVAPFAILAATAHVDDDVRAACTEAGMDGFLGKPLDLALLGRELRRTAFAVVARHDIP